MIARILSVGRPCFSFTVAASLHFISLHFGTLPENAAGAFLDKIFFHGTEIDLWRDLGRNKYTNQMMGLFADVFKMNLDKIGLTTNQIKSSSIKQAHNFLWIHTLNYSPAALLG